MRALGLAKQIVKDVIQDTLLQVGRMDTKAGDVEAVVDAENVASQRVAKAALKVERESDTDSEFGRPGYRYTQRYDIPNKR
jgi:RimJ/RimL family protein N-acetyltransferase